MFKKLFQSLAAVILVCTGASAFAQTRTVIGKVLDTAGQPVIGAAVVQSGTTNGVMTLPDGTFSLKVPTHDAVLTVSSLGYQTKDVTVAAGQNNIEIVLEEDNLMIEETVVVGYGTQKKVNLTGAISTVSSKQLENRTSHSVTSMLQGAVPGLNITTSAGNPGATPDINIRGITSINGASPMVLVDGAEGDLSRVNPDDVASISVIKDAAAAAVYGARAAFGVILITTKSGESKAGKGATVHYNGKFGWEQPTTSTDYESRGYWSVYAANLFWRADTGTQYIRYDDYDMQQLLARINDKTENPDRPWVVITKNKSGQDAYKYYGNTDFYHVLFSDRHPVQQHNLSLSGGNKKARYFVSGAWDNESGILKQNPDEFNKFNIRSKVDFEVNKWLRFSNNTSFYTSTYDYIGVNSINDAISYGNAHGLSCFVPQNPDGTWVYKTDWTDYAVNNGRQIVFGNDHNTNLERKNDFSNTSEAKITPTKHLTFTANFTYRLRNNNTTRRKTNFIYSPGPGREGVYNSGAGEDLMSETVAVYHYKSANAFGTYDNTWNDAHHLTVTGGANYEDYHYKNVYVLGKNLVSETLTDLDLIGVNANGVIDLTAEGGQSAYALMGYFGRINYDYKGKYLVEVSGRYDGTSRFASGSRWGFFPSTSLGWRISEEPWFDAAKDIVNNLKLRASYGELGNQVVSNYAYMRTISLDTFAAYSFNEGSGKAKYSTISAPNSSSLTWETAQQYNIGLDASFFNSRLDLSAEAYIRDTKGMLTSGAALPSTYGASAPKENNADLRTKGYEFQLSWRDGFDLAGKTFNYYVKGSLSNYASYITKFDNPTKSFAKDYYEGMRLGDIWGFCTDGLFATDEEAQAYASQFDLGYITKRLTGGWLAGDVKYLDLDTPVYDANGNITGYAKDGKLGIGQNTADDPGDRKILGNSLPSLQYGIQLGFDWTGFDFSVFFQGVGTHYVYPHYEMMQFWGGYSRPYVSYLPSDFLGKIWSEDNPDAYLPRPRAYSAYTSGAYLRLINDRYLQNSRYLRLKNLTFGYSLPERISNKINVEKIRVYFSGENLAYWSPLKKATKYLDPEMFTKANSDGYADLGLSDARFYNAIYPWQASYMFGIDITL